VILFYLETIAGHVQVVKGGRDDGGEHVGRDQPGDERCSRVQRHPEVDHASHHSAHFE